MPLRDPVDGTKAFITGTHGFGTLIGLCYRQVPVLGLLHQPVLAERWLGVRGKPTLPHSDSSLEEDVGNTVLFPDPAADTLVSRIQAAGLRHEAIRTAD